MLTNKYALNDDRIWPARGVFYIEFLRLMHHKLTPKRYFEIGIETGASLQVASCQILAVDPQFKISQDVIGKSPVTAFFQMPSDDFFAAYDLETCLGGEPDICFLDGMHRYEYLLRDFMNTEKHCSKRSIIVIHDCLPINDRMSLRDHVNGPEEEGDTRFAWTGDVWKIIPILKDHRPDLRILFFDCPPSGLVVVTNLDRNSNILAQNYHAILDRYRDLGLADFDKEKLWRSYPMLDSQRLFDNGNDLTSFF